ncbi:MAG TPA: hypothetical protein VJ969_11430, partial [Desulfopila sp.]|nr:hypothetical protein [Desulfopila sp.]
MKNRNVILLILTIHVALLSGCSQVATTSRVQDTSPPPAVTTKEKPFTHTVGRKGENLTLISKWYTGSVGNWPAIARANPSIRPDR